MRIPKITEMVGRDMRVRFSFYRGGELWYKAENGFEFPVPVSDTGTGTFLAEDKSIYFMRWIRKHLESLNDALNDAQ